MIFLTSTGFTNPKVYQIIEKDSVKPIKRACIIAVGLVPLKHNHPIAIMTRDFIFKKGIKEVNFFDLQEEDSKNLLDYDLVIILGGDSCNLFRMIKKSGADIILKELAESGCHIVGASAGAMLLSSGNEYTKYFNQIIGLSEGMEGLSDTEGLKFTEHILFPHYDMFLEKVSNLDEQLSKLESKYNISITRLRNMEFIYINSEGDTVFVEN